MNIPDNFSLESQRLRLRGPQEADIPHIFSASRYEGFTDGMGWEPPEDQSEMLAPFHRAVDAWKAGRGYAFSIDKKDDQQFVGRISIRKTDEAQVWNIGFWTHPEHQGQGYMTEAVRQILDFGFSSLEAIRITAEHALWNKASERVLQKNGFLFVSYIEQGLFKRGKWEPEHRLAIEKKDWQVK